MTLKYFVSWDNGASACGTFATAYDTYEEADSEGSVWAYECNASQGFDPENGPYTYEVVSWEVDDNHISVAHFRTK